MHIFCRVRGTFNSYRRAGSTEWIMVLAIAGILLSTGDDICGWFLNLVAPLLANQFNALEKGQRVLLVGVPCAALFLAVTLGVQGWDAWRHKNCQHYRRDVRDDANSDN